MILEHPGPNLQVIIWLCFHVTSALEMAIATYEFHQSLQYAHL